MYDNSKNLLFLLAAAPLATGCVLTITDDVADDETSGDGDGDASTTGDGDGDASTGDGDGDPATGDGDGDPTTTGDGDGDPTTTGDGDGDPTTTGDGDGDGGGSAICESYGALVSACYSEAQGMSAQMYCNEYLAYLENMYGAECVTAYEDFLACLSLLTCEEFGAPGPCPDEAAAIQLACSPGGSIQLLGLRHK